MDDYFNVSFKAANNENYNYEPQYQERTDYPPIESQPGVSIIDNPENIYYHDTTRDEPVVYEPPSEPVYESPSEPIIFEPEPSNNDVPSPSDSDDKGRN